ncbi:PTS IIA-like nitrogen regulatory protein PtsN [Haliea sp. E17]|uniref:PTS IIA-like nitrogen regulatory protein PtsN n=1 Tax=Haliea sp. E17 TaxID=3401576 RepID=UPI003AAF29FC
MQSLADLLTPERTASRVPGLSKKRLFESLARIISNDLPGISYDAVFSNLIAREKLGSTGLGQGIAIPHCRMPGCEGPVGALLTLAEPIEFDAPDNQPVDLVFALLVPEGEEQRHLNTLAGIARQFSQADYCARLRAAENDEALFAVAEAGVQ